MSLVDLITGPGNIGEIAAHLDALSTEERWKELYGLNKAHQRTLFLKAEGSPPLQLEAFVGAHPVVHRGRNSLPLFRNFEKHMVQVDDAVWGFNEGFTRSFVGPGYFRCRKTKGDECVKASWVVDYWQVPGAAPHASWPDPRSNGWGLSFFVYHRTRDYMRGVCEGVTIGSAHKWLLGKERRLDSYFLLMRA